MTEAVLPNWYAVHTHMHSEARAAAHLMRQGFSVYFPRYLKRRRHARRVDMVAAPLFPRYLFLKIDQLAQRWMSIKSTVGVSSLVCNGDVPAIVPTSVIEEIKRREDPDGLFQFGVGARFSPGDKVRVTDGAFADCLGLFEGLKDKDRIAILLNLLGRKVRVVLDAETIVAA